jgi:hypothetical protein
MNTIQIAAGIAKAVHAGQRLKYVDGVYYNEHIKHVVRLVRSEEEKALAFLHDVPEEFVSYWKKKRLKGKPPESPGEKFMDQKINEFFGKKPFDEGMLITKTIDWIAEEFTKNGHPMDRYSPLMEDLDIITKRSSDKGYEGSKRYIERMIWYAEESGRIVVVVVKRSDLHNNMRADRNPRPESLSKDEKIKLVTRLNGYAEFDGMLITAVPEATLLADPKMKLQPKQGNLHLSSRGRALLAYKQGLPGRHRRKWSPEL